MQEEQTKRLGYMPSGVSVVSTKIEAWHTPTSASEGKKVEQKVGDGSI